MHHQIFHFLKSRADCQRHETSSKGARYLGGGGGSPCTPDKFLNLKSLKYHFLDFSGRFYTILLVRKQYYTIEIYIFLGKSAIFLGKPSKYYSTQRFNGQQYFRVLHLVYVILDPGSIDQKGIYCPKRQLAYPTQVYTFQIISRNKFSVTFAVKSI